MQSPIEFYIHSQCAIAVIQALKAFGHHIIRVSLSLFHDFQFTNQGTFLWAGEVEQSKPRETFVVIPIIIEIEYETRISAWWLYTARMIGPPTGLPLGRVVLLISNAFNVTSSGRDWVFLESSRKPPSAVPFVYSPK